MKYYGGCDVGSTYTKAVILDETGKIVADTTIRSKINSEQSAIMAMNEVVSKVPELSSSKDLAYLIGTGYGRNKVPFADVYKRQIVDGEDVHKMSGSEMAQKIAYVPQSAGAVNMTVFDTGLLGRKPYIKWDVTSEDVYKRQAAPWP